MQASIIKLGFAIYTELLSGKYNQTGLRVVVARDTESSPMPILEGASWVRSRLSYPAGWHHKAACINKPEPHCPSYKMLYGSGLVKILSKKHLFYYYYYQGVRWNRSKRKGLNEHEKCTLHP